MNHKRITSNHARPRLAYGIAAWAAIMAGGFALAAGQTGCSTIAGGFSGAIHGLADDMDGLTDKLARDKQGRVELQRGRYE